MKIKVDRRAAKAILGWAQLVLFASALVLLGYCGFVIADTWVFQQRESRSLQHLLDTHSTPFLPAVAPRGLIGRIEIPRLGVSAVVIEGDDAKTLRRAVGHIPGTPMPGEQGNIALTGHRDTFFRPLRNIREDDLVMVTTLQGVYRYRVVSTQIVTPDNVSVLNAGDGEMLTLVTCYPFYFVGAAPDRFIVRAERLTSPQRVRRQPRFVKATTAPHSVVRATT